MPRRSQKVNSSEDLNIWGAFTDLMSNAFMILILFLFLMIVKMAITQINLGKTQSQKDEELKALKAKANRTEQLNKQVADLQNQLNSVNKKTGAPPIIVIEDQATYRFSSGSAEIPKPMFDYITNQIVPEIERNANKYQINVVEIIGHTDGQSNGVKASNLDQNLEQVASANIPIGTLKSGSNADLGLMRALSVVKTLQYIQTREGKLKGLKFRAYSAAQLILPNGDFAPINRKADTARRRIEIRFTRLGEVTKVPTK